jgi:Antirestriction protein
MDNQHNPPADGKDAIARIDVRRVDDSRRLATLPRYFGHRLMMFESTVYDFMHQFAPDYRGGFWQFYELSNRGFYMAPDRDSFRFCVNTNGFEGVLSADAAGLTVCLFTYSHLSFQDIRDDLFADHFHRLREFAVQHTEAAEIFAAID